MSLQVATDYKDTRLGRYICMAFGYSSAEAWIKDKAERLLQLTRQSLPPFNLKPILKLRHISHDIKYDPSLSCRAKIFSVDSGFEIRMKEGLKYYKSKEKWRFTVAHEIGHTFFYDLEKTPPLRYPLIPFADSVEEQLCDTFASELLMPTESVRKEFFKDKSETSDSKYLAQFQNLFRMKQSFGVSLGALCLKLKLLGLWNILLFFCRWQPKFPYHKNSSLPQECEFAWRSVWSVVPIKFEQELFIPNPSMKRPGRPTVHIKTLEELYKSDKQFEVAEFDIPRSDLRIGNLPKILEKVYGKNSHYKVLIGKISHQKIATNLDIFSRYSERSKHFDSRQHVDYLVGVPLGE
ncbi:MAG: ImmA/IrrE family metallo-endopeptidase [Deltaproteobacteria bacterium]|nr:ImmA/IrrE family metallo-endopeptidase [Deltaproteobacteria bacterium]